MTTLSDFTRGLEAAAKIADLYATENWDMVTDANTLRAGLRDYHETQIAYDQFYHLVVAADHHADLALFAQRIATAIRAAKETP